MKSYLSVARQVPEFVRAEYPAFLEFLKAYYQWYEEEYSVGKVLDVTMLDSAPAEFLKYFRKQLDIFGITANTDNRMFLEHIKELYTAKGSSAGVDFLFKIIFNKPATVIQPWDYVFKPSDGKWTQDTTIIVGYVAGLEQLLNTTIIVTDSDGREYKTYVRAVLQRPDSSAEIFVTRFAPLSDLVSLRSLDGTITANALKVFGSVKIINPGAGYYIGFVGTSTTTSGGIDSDIVYKVKAIDENGGLKAIEILTFGRSFDLASKTVSPAHGLENVGQIQFYPGTFCVYPGYYLDSTNIIGDLVYIQDSYYYQIHSYVTVVEESLDKYGALLQQVLHPTGTKQFAALLLGDVFQLALTVDPQLNLISRADALRDFLIIEGEPFFEVIKLFENTITANDSFDRVVSYVRGASDGFAEELTTADAYSLIIGKALEDGVAAEDVLSRVAEFFRTFESIVAATDAVALQSGKNLAHSVATSDNLQRVIEYIRGASDGFADTAATSDALSKAASKGFGDTVTVGDSAEVLIAFLRDLQSTVAATDNTITFAPGKNLSTSVATSDNLQRVAEFIRALEDAATVTDALQFQASRSLSDTAFVTDAITILPGIELVDTIVTSDTKAFVTDKYIGDVVLTSNSGAIYGTPFYTDVPTEQYWEVGYLENERNITN